MGRLTRILRRAIVVAAALTLPGALPARAEPVRRVSTEEKYIAITFDDGPNEEKTKEILRILAENDAKATFFVIGKNAEAHPDRIREIFDAGHEIGNHTWSHRYLTKMNPDQIREEVGKTEEILTKICGERPRVFRPPGGYYSPESVSQVEGMGYACVLWSVDTRDWTMNEARSIIKKVESGAAAGEIVLFHDLGDKRLSTPDALRVVLPRLREEGYRFVTVSELLGR